MVHKPTEAENRQFITPIGLQQLHEPLWAVRLSDSRRDSVIHTGLAETVA